MAPLKHPALYGLSSETVPPGLALPAAAAKASKGSRHVWQSCEGSASSLSSLCVPYSQAVRMPFNTTMHPRTQQTYLQPDHVDRVADLLSPSAAPSAEASGASLQDGLLTTTASASLMAASAAAGRMQRAPLPCRQPMRGPGATHITSSAPQASLASFDSAIAVRASNSMTTTLQPRAYSASHALGRQARPAQTGCLPRMASIEAVRLSSNAVPQQEPSLSPDVSKISFRILTSGSKWAGQRGPYSPLTPIPDSPNTPLHWCRCSVHRTKHGGYKDGRFEMQDSFNGVTLVAQRTTRSRSYDIFMYSRIAGLNPNVDPVHMAISYGKPLEGCKHALVIIPGNPGVQQKAQAINTQEDLGNEHAINDMIDRLTKGHLVPGVQAFRSRMPIGSVFTRLHQLPFDGRQVVTSNKNLQLQLDSRLTAWPTVRAATKYRTNSSAGTDPGKTESLGLGRSSGKVLVFQCGRLDAEEFICDFTPKVAVMVLRPAAGPERMAATMTGMGKK
ncbi:MAG: hypothetical protein FRX49_10599 [Trebouxia sp. A1-2]|nr:MAG: hypothetical protein FRX49_10599 [Trebouxia sp. A1-2]